MDSLPFPMPAFEPGTVWLVGAGPGDPGLMTLQALHAIRSADIVVYDALVDPRAHDAARPGTEIVFAGKRGGRPSQRQPDISVTLIEHARQGLRVARLKGGDPFVFGRGGEEAEACRAAGVPVEVVPGVTSALGAAAAAQIALTHRDAASVVSFVAGQCKGLAEQDWAGLAGKGRTLVIYMGVKTAPAIAEKLMADGLAPDMPLAVIENACRPGMRVLRAPLAGLPELVAGARVRSPALIVIGEVTAREDVALGQLVAEFAQ
jgi:uroporphyrin-III C-methyltransferase